MITKEFLAGVAAAIAVTLAAPAAQAVQPHWAIDHCTNYGASDHASNGAMSSWTRANAQSYAYVGNKEGYQWGGGCNNDDDRDNQPGDPTETSSTMGEGTDCSGLVFKSWALPYNNVDGYYNWNKMNFEHGPNIANSYKTGLYNGTSTAAAAYFKLSSKSRSSTAKMDAFAKVKHIGLLYTNDGTSNGQDYIMESYTEKDGTDLNVRNYRNLSEFSGVRRDQWRTDGYCHMCE